jgi:DNA polymerase-3 subunit beta
LTVTVDRLSLANALKTALPAVGKGVQIPAYQAVRISGGNSRLNVTATDGDLSIISVAEAQLDHADEDGIAVVVAARLVANIVGSMRGDTVNLTVEDGTLRVSSERGTYDLRTLPVEDFPNVVAAEGTSITIDAATKTKLASIVYAASRDEARPILCGVGIGEGWAAATDSYRLSAVRIGDLPACILPARVLDLVCKSAGPVTLTIDDTRATFRSDDGTTWTTRLIAGTFPSWQRLVGEPSHVLRRSAVSPSSSPTRSRCG